MTIILRNLRTDRIPLRVANMLWPEVDNVDQTYACALRESTESVEIPRTGSTSHENEQSDRTAAQMRLEMSGESPA